MVKKGDIATIVVTAFITLLLFITSFIPKENLKAYVYADGELVHEPDFKSVQRPYIFTVNGCEIEISEMAKNIMIIRDLVPTDCFTSRARLPMKGKRLFTMQNY